MESDDFTFVVNGDPIVRPLTEAIMLSSIVYDLIQSDRSCRSFSVNTTEATSADFARFLEFIRSPSIGALPRESALPFLSFCRLLGNDGLALVLLALLHPRVLPIGGAISCVHLIDTDYCASHFYAYSVSELQVLDRKLLHRILGSPSLSLVSEDALLRVLVGLGDDFAELWDCIEVSFLSGESISLFVDRLGFANLTSGIWEKIGTRLKGETSAAIKERRFPLRYESMIYPLLPCEFGWFHTKRWDLLYRGSKDGFRAANFHQKCDGHANTVTVIQTAAGCIFGGFTPVAWDSTSGTKSDSTNQSFLFRIKDLKGSEPRKFPLSGSSYAIWCGSSYGPIFGSNHDICLYDSFHEGKRNYTILGGSYVNDTEIPGNQVLAGEETFTVQEIEVFSIGE
jgi:hypothetical protein